MNAGDVLVRKTTGERFLVGHVTKTPTSSLIYARREDKKGKGWHDFAILLEDALTEFDVEDDGLGDLDI